MVEDTVERIIIDMVKTVVCQSLDKNMSDWKRKIIKAQGLRD